MGTPAGKKPQPPDRDPALWSPPQFSLRVVFRAILLIAVLCSVLKTVGPGALPYIALLSLMAWFAVKIAKLPNQPKAGVPGGSDVPSKAHGPIETNSYSGMAVLGHLAQTTPLPVDAFLFVLDALRRASPRARQSVAQSQPGGVDAEDFCWSVRELALADYGGKAAAGRGLASLGIHGCKDLGQILCHLFDAGLVIASGRSELEAFPEVFDFAKAFETSESASDNPPQDSPFATATPDTASSQKDHTTADELVILRTFRIAGEAHVAKATLESARIQAFLENEDATLTTLCATNPSGLKRRVRRRDLKEAIEILKPKGPL